MRRTTVWLAVYLAFVVYGSLVPLEYRDLPFDAAWQRFSEAPFLVLGVESRADWVANGVLYLPVGVLATLALRRALYAPWWVAGALAWSFSVAIAFAVEFAQVYFPPRTVSRNDLLAEAIGSGAGALIAPWVGGWLERARAAFVAQSGRLVVLGLKAYFVLYVAFCFFPYDLLVSGAELGGKVDSGMWGWLLAPADRGGLIVAVKLAVEVLLTLPIGVLLRRIQPRISPLATLAAGAGLGVAIELGQFLIASGISQGLSALARAVGVVLGAAVPDHLPDDLLLRLRMFLRRYTWALLLLYLPLLAAVNGLLTGSWRGFSGAESTWKTVRLLPLYYHYYTSEAVALFSLASVAAMYVPLALLGWAHRFPRSSTVSLVTVAATAVEACKLLVHGLRPDPTNVLIAAGTCWALLSAADRLGSRSVAPRSPSRPSASSSSSGVDATPSRPPQKVRRTQSPARASASPTPYADKRPLLAASLAGLVTLAVAIASWLGYPSFKPVFGIALVAYGVLLVARPNAWLLLMPTAIAMLDLAPWSGRTYWDELDILLCITLGVLLLRREASPRLRDVPAALWVLAVSAAVGAAWSWATAPVVDFNRFAGLLSPFASLVMLKIIVWAGVLWMLVADVRRRGSDVLEPLSAGFVLATVALFAFTLWEKQTYSLLLEFSTTYRATGPSSAANVGGAYLEAFVALWMPFALCALATPGRFGPRVVGAIAALGSVYVALATVARSAVAAVAAAALMFAILRTLIARPMFAERSSRPAVSWAVAVGVCALVAAAIVMSGLRDRMSAASNDWSVRMSHWQRTLDIKPGGLIPALFGSGPGSFPRVFATKADAQPPSHSVQEAADRSGLLQINGGPGYYVEQVVPFARNERYMLSFSARRTSPEAMLVAMLCAKSLIYSLACEAVEVRPEEAWKRYVFTLHGARLGALGLLGGPGVKLSFASPTLRSSVQIDDVMLLDGSGGDVLANGTFDHGQDHWFFSSDDHLAWHAKSLPLHLWFEYGGVGLTAMIWLTAVSLVRAARYASPSRAAALIAGVLGFFLLGAFDSLVDSPRVMLALLLTLAAGSTAGGTDRSIRWPA